MIFRQENTFSGIIFIFGFKNCLWTLKMPNFCWFVILSVFKICWFLCKKLLILDTVAGNSVTPWTLLLNIYVSQIFFYNCSTAEVLYSIWAVVWSEYQALRPVSSRLYHHKEVSLGTKCQKVRDCNTSSDFIFILRQLCKTDFEIKNFVKSSELQIPTSSSGNPHYF